ncbi:MAG: bifunctional metallophosphatase/5'-nucleotidase [Bacteroidetes bacterium HGW-Bacteroidetes-8]|jgi:2',3'-cyclic-nucleotide 2'-phosphodiesterase/3'-nucleotidase|nr:MAG: bifunctional metallophosphatase/5'-nucleotidase [Bacteroidetes bacterium HGW-Bacteroidetes-8]
MKTSKLFLISLISLFSLFSSLSCNRESVNDGVHTFRIYATNDLHGRFFDSLFTDKGAQRVHPYSLASVYNYVKDSRISHGEKGVILIDVGDHLQGDNSAFYFNYIDTNSVHIFSKIVNFMKYDAVVVGNHDIESGHPVYDKIVKEMDAPYLAANALDEKSGTPYFLPYTILVRDGVKIAVIGMTNPNIPKWLSPELWKGIRFEEMVPSIEYWIDKIRTKESPHIVIAAIHGGLGEEETYTPENPARYIARNIKGLDIVFASHDHKSTAEKIYNGEDSVWLFEGGSRASFLSSAIVNLSFSDGEVVSKCIEGEIIPMKDIPGDSQYLDNFRDDFLKVKSFTNQFVGTLNNRISTRSAYFGPSEYIDMIHTLQLVKSKAEISFVAPLSFDVTIEAGNLNFQDLLNIYPYENQLYVIEMEGVEIKNYLEFSYSKWVNKMDKREENLLHLSSSGLGERSRFKNVFFNFDSAAGLIYEVNVTKDEGDMVSILSMADGTPFDPKRRYRVALSSYRANGGGDLLEQGAGISKDEMESRVVERLSDIRELIYQYLKENGSLTATKLNHWRIVPEEFIKEAAKRDFKTLFGVDIE